MSEACKNNIIFVEEDCNNTSSPSVILAKDVVFGSHSPSQDYGSCNRDYNNIQLSQGRAYMMSLGSSIERDEPVISPDDLLAKTRYFARIEALSIMEDEH